MDFELELTAHKCLKRIIACFGVKIPSAKWREFVAWWHVRERREIKALYQETKLVCASHNKVVN
jgi:hypothetical protein